MIINKDVSIKELYIAGIVEKDIYLYFRNKRCNDVKDVILFSEGNDSLYSYDTKINSFLCFLRLYLFCIKWLNDENESTGINLISKLPDKFLFVIQTIYKIEKYRFNADRVLSIFLSNETDLNFLSFFLHLITSPKKILDRKLFQENYNRKKTEININAEYERFIYFIIAFISNTKNALGNISDCEYFKNIIVCAIDEIGFGEKEIKCAEIYASAINNKTDQNAGQNIEKEGSMEYIRNVIQEKYEELQCHLSVRARNIINYNIPNYTDSLPWVTGEKKDLRFRNCGAKSTIELNGFIDEFREYYTLISAGLYNTKASNPNGVKVLSYLIELTIECNNLNTEEYCLLRGIYNTWDVFIADITDMNVVYKKIHDNAPNETLDCLNWLKKMFSDIILLISNYKCYDSYKPIFFLARKKLDYIIEENVVELEYEKFISDEKETMIRETFENMLSKSSVLCQNIIRKNDIYYKKLLTYEGREQEFINIKSVGRKCARELANLLGSFKVEYEIILKTSDKEAKTNNLRPKFPYLYDFDLDFVYSYEKKFQHLPMFYILTRFFENSNNPKTQIFASFCGLAKYSDYSLDKISQRFGFTRERVRQIIEKQEFRSDAHYLNLTAKILWQPYKLEFDGYYTKTHPLYDIIIREEQVTLSYYTFCNILSLFLGIKLLNISESGKVLSSSETAECVLKNIRFVTYCYKSCFRHFKFSMALKEVRRLINLKRNKIIRIPLYSYIVTNTDYWDKKYIFKEDECQHILTLIEDVIQNTFSSCICNNCLILEANKLNHQEIMYSILKENGGNMHVNEIFTKYKEIYPGSKYEDANQIKHFLQKDLRIKNIGRSSLYTLIEWNNYTGSLPRLAIDLTTRSAHPIMIPKLKKEMLKYRPDSTDRSIQSIIWQCIDNKKLTLFYGDLVGLPGKKYNGNYIIMPRSFNEWLYTFRNFVLQNDCFPCPSSGGFERTLYHWYNEAKSYINLSSEEIKKFHQLMVQFERIPHTLTEKRFLNNCLLYKEYVKRKGKMIERVDDKNLYDWFYCNISKYSCFNDNRHYYFKELLNFLDKNI